MHQTKVLLRRAVIERNIQGSMESRDIAIERFLGEVRELFTERMIRTIPADTLGGMFEDWLSTIGILDFDERLKALALDVRLCAIPYTMYSRGFVDDRDIGSEAEPPGNVVSLHAR